MTTGNRPRASILILWLAALIAGSAGTAALGAEGAEWGLAQLMESMAAVKTSRSKFSEKKHLAILNAPLVSSGTLLFRAPDRLEKHTLSPRKAVLILEGERLTIEDAEAGKQRTVELQAYPVIRAFVEGVRATLAGDLDALSRYYRVTLDGHRAGWRLTLRPVDPEMQALVKIVLIDGSGSRIRTLEIVESAGDRSVMTITKDDP